MRSQPHARPRGGTATGRGEHTTSPVVTSVPSAVPSGRAG